jgi:hypothetical protein
MSLPISPSKVLLRLGGLELEDDQIAAHPPMTGMNIVVLGIWPAGPVRFIEGRQKPSLHQRQNRQFPIEDRESLIGKLVE